MSVRWMQLGWGKTAPTEQDTRAPRNLFGVKDGTNNIEGNGTAELDKHVWVNKC